MLGKMVGAFVMIAIAVALFPVINDGIKNAQTNITSTPTEISGELNTMLDFVPIFFIATVALIVLMIIWNAFRDSGLGSEAKGVEGEESDDEDDDSTDDDVANEDEESTPEPDVKKHSTMITTRKKDGRVRTNVTLNPTGYNVDKYELEKPTDVKLSYKEDNFKKTKYD